LHPLLHLHFAPTKHYKVVEVQEQIESVEQKYARAQAQRRKLEDELQSIKGNIRVFVRVRPMLKHEVARGETELIKCREDR
jgi:septal ring factor EnvC (AmiA/AmiB activator)